MYVFFLCACVYTNTHNPTHPIPAPASAPIPTPEAHHTSVMSYHVTSHALQGQHTHRHTPHHHTQHLIGRSVCDGFLSCVWRSLFLFHCLCLKVCVCPRVVVSRACMCLFVCLCGGECSVTNTPTLTLTHHTKTQTHHTLQHPHM